MGNHSYDLQTRQASRPHLYLLGDDLVYSYLCSEYDTENHVSRLDDKFSYISANNGVVFDLYGDS